MSRTIFIPIKPEYCHQILIGNKTWEFRKKIPKEPIEKMVIYSSGNEGVIRAIANVDRIISGKPEEIWEITQESSGIERDRYSEYFQSCDIAYAIKLGKISPTIAAKPSYFGIKVPQSFCYLSDEQNERIHSITQIRILVSGIHGAGKSTLCHRISDANPNITYVTCSEIIKYNGKRTTIESINQNQDSIINEIENIHFQDRVVLIDGHLALFKDNKVAKLNARTIARLKLSAISILLRDPWSSENSILQKKNEKLGVRNLQKLQEAEVSFAFELSRINNTPLYISNDANDLCSKILSHAKSDIHDHST